MDEELLGGASEAVIVVDEQLTTRAVNEAALTLVGYRREQLLGRSAGHLVAFGPEWLAQEWRIVLARGAWYGDIALRSQGGGICHITADLTLVQRAGDARVVIRMTPR
jgi:PAS domain S-box-containing protein